LIYHKIIIAILILPLAIGVSPIAHTSESSDLNRFEIPFVNLGTQTTVLFVDVEINGIQGRFLVDTGSALSIITTDAIKLFGIQSVSRIKQTLTGANATVTKETDLFLLPQIFISGIEFEYPSFIGVELAIAGQSAEVIAGVLGQNFLVKNGVVLDFERRVISIQIPDVSLPKSHIQKRIIGVWGGDIEGEFLKIIIDGNMIYATGAFDDSTQYQLQENTITYAFFNRSLQRAVEFESETEMLWIDYDLDVTSRFTKIE
jgi:hypothetical protein